MSESLETAERVFRTLKIYCRISGKNLDLPPNASEVTTVGFWVAGATTKSKEWCEEGDGWYEAGEGYLPRPLLSHLEEDNDLLIACRQAVTEAMTHLSSSLREDRHGSSHT